ncbi:MAG: hypothetical protein A2X80_02420 [Geobacteraceae bacterium GWB2_52_12]|nr:MAG: hypothetical protein A2X80_02420 [Geobacteraceae bacterium GWB2_52_12]
MAIVNHAKREINAKIVYYGPADAGKTTSLRYVYDRIKPSLRGDFKTLPASGSSLLFFDFSPFEQPVFAGYRLRIHVYTLQGKVANPAAWKMTLKGADGLMIVADASAEGTLLQQSVVEVRDYMGAYGIGLDAIPVVLQLNKGDLAVSLDPLAVAREVGVAGLSATVTTATKGDGILEAVTTLSRMVMEQIREREDLAQEKCGTLSRKDDTEKEYSSGGNDLAMVAADIPKAQVDVQTDVGPLFVSVVHDMIAVEGTTICIPLNLSWQGGTQRLVVTVAVASEQVVESDAR